MNTLESNNRGMKTPSAIGLVLVSVLVTLAIEESRIAALRSSVNPAPATRAELSPATPVAGAGPNRSADSSGPPVRPAARPAAAPDPALAAAEDESFAKTARKMWDNPAGKSMMSQGVKMAVGMMYQDFIDGLKLTKEEGGYLKDLLGKQMADQQELGMKLLGASDDERKALTEEITQRSNESDAQIRKFLNSEEDSKSFSDYKSRLPEHQQLDGIRSAMNTQGTPLDADTEASLVDAMYRARTEAGTPDLSGPGALDEMAKGTLTATFETSWDKQQATLQAEAAKILSEPQLSAFQDYQKQMKEMQLMGLKMAEKMLPGKKTGAP